MALTNFSLLTNEQKTVWSRETWKQARDNMFVNRFMGTGPNSMIQRITELTRDERGARAVITLVADLEGDGVTADNQLEGEEEGMLSYDQVITLDQLRHAVRHEGEMAEQKSVVRFRGHARDALAYWYADRVDQLAFLTLAGIAYTTKTNGATRTGSNLGSLAFAADVTAPTTNRYYNWDASATDLIAGNTATVAADDTPSWKMLVQLKAAAQNSFIRPIRGEMGTAAYNVFMTPDGIAKLKTDSDFINIMKDAQSRGASNPLFKGADVIQLDGLNIFTYRHVPNTRGLAAGSKWGAAGAIEGQACLLCGAQALAMADIGIPRWIEKQFDYDNQPGIAIRKIFGLKKPVFRSSVDAANEDFSVIRVNTAI